jgi:hypothetical protein
MIRIVAVAVLAVLAAAPAAALNTNIPGSGLPSAADYATAAPGARRRCP